jgi:hypothetical protein
MLYVSKTSHPPTPAQPKWEIKGKSLSKTCKAHKRKEKKRKAFLKKVVAMGSSGKLLRIIFLISAVAAAASMAKPGCHSKCGDVEIPFPFGFTEGCYLDKRFNITCDDSRKPMTAAGNVPITNISTDTHQMHVMNLVAIDCYQRDGLLDRRNGTALKVGSQFTISDKKNTFTVIGCDTIAYLRGYQNGEAYEIGCSSECPSLSNVVNGSCSGVGCCEVGFPDGLKDITVEVRSFHNHSKVWSFNRCGYAFVVKKGTFNFSADYLKKLPNETVPLVLDWGIPDNHGCEKAQNERNYACKENSECTDRRRIKQGYYCKCKQGYQGNPYLHGHGGCQGSIHIFSS